MFKRMSSEVEGLLIECVQIAYFMRGAVQYDDLLMKSVVERSLMTDFIAKRLEVEKEKLNPVY